MTSFRRPLAVVSLGYVVLLMLGAAAAPLLAPYSPTATDLDHVLSGPSPAHPLGTDGLGRDVLSRLLHGGRVSLVDAAVAVLTVLFVGVSSGLVAGFRGGWLDRIFTWVVDVMLAIPVIVTLLLVLTVIGDDQLPAMIALGVFISPGLARVTRGLTLTVRNELYIAAARVSGLPNRHIVIGHVLPRVAGPIIVQVSLLAGGALLIDAGLSYLGLGVQPPTPTWGSMIADASGVVDRQPWLLVPPGVVLGLAILSFGVLGDALRDTRAERSPRIKRRPLLVSSSSTAPTTSLLSIQDVSIALPRAGGPVAVVEHLDLEIAKGEAVGLVGESGCGKSVTGRAILGLLPVGGAVTAGAIVFEGQALDARSVRRMRGSQIGMISQDPLAGLDPVFAIGHQVDELVRRHHGGSRKAVRARTLDLLDSMNLPDPELVAKRYPHELSGGMAQRIGIAMALAGEPKLLIADEPTTALDVTVQVEILTLLGRLRTERGMAILLISHDWGVVARVCQRAYVMYAGHVVESCDVTDLFERPLHPYTVGLLGAAPHRSRPGQHLAAIPGTVPAPSAWPSGCHFAPRCDLATADCGAAPIPLRETARGHGVRCINYSEIGEGGDHERAVTGRP